MPSVCRLSHHAPVGDPGISVLAGTEFVQTESELAAISLIIGGAAMGQRVMTSSSGPGFSLKQEGISYLASMELPAVIVDVMRYGYGLGTITVGQCDYFQAVKGGGHRL